MVQFHEACKRLALPVQFGTEELKQGNYGKVASTLVFVAHTAASQNVGVKQMDPVLRHRLESVTTATEQINNMSSEQAKAMQSPEGIAALPWWQQLLIKLGLGDWIDYLNYEALAKYAAQVKANVEAKAEEFKANVDVKTEEAKVLLRQKSDELKQKLPEAVQQKLA